MGNLKNRSGNLFYQTSKYHRFTGFDILKFLCAFLIVCIHSPFPGMIGEYFTALTRIAVPIFFMITGFYYSDIEWRDRTIEQIKKIFILVVEANLLYLLWKCFYAVASGDGLIPYIEEILTEKCIAKFVILNESPFNGHLWYLGAILYVLLIVESLRRFGGGVLVESIIRRNSITPYRRFTVRKIFNPDVET